MPVTTISRNEYFGNFSQTLVSTGENEEKESTGEKEGTLASLKDDRDEGGNTIPAEIPQLKSSLPSEDDDIGNFFYDPRRRGMTHTNPEDGLGSQSKRQGEVTNLDDTTLTTREQNSFVEEEEEEEVKGLGLQTLQDPNSDRPFDDEEDAEKGLDLKVDYPLLLTKKELLEMEKYSQLAYSRELDDTSEPYDSTVLRGINMTVDGPQKIRGGDANIYTNAICRIFLLPEKIIFAFKGTDFPFSSDTLMGDILSDLQVKVDNLTSMGGIDGKVPYDELGIVHQGFNRFVDSLFPQILNKLQQYPDKSPIFLGHSLGAISALIAGYRLYLETGRKVERIYQFGSPMGITTFGSIGNILDIINVIHTHDVVPNYMSIFKHHGTKIVIDIHNNYKIYQGGEYLPFIYREPDTTKAYMVRKNFNIKDINWDKYFQGRGSAFTSFFNTIENVRSLWTGLSYPLMTKSRDRTFHVITEWGGPLAHTKYKEHIENALPDEILLPSFDLHRDIREVFRKTGGIVEYDPNPKSSYRFNPIDDIYVGENKQYITSHDSHHIYKDKTTNEISIINQRQGQMKSRVLNPKLGNPIGLYLYEKDEDIENKVVMFKV